MHYYETKKALGAIILGAMLLSMIACGEQDTQTPMSDTVPATEEVTTAETEPAYTLPEKDMAGWTLSIMNSTEDSLTWANTRITVTEQDGDVLNDAIFNRNADLMEKYNFTLSVEEIPFSNIPATLKKNVMAGDDVYQIYSMNEGAIASYLSNIADWNNIPGMNLDDIWWNPNATSVYNIAGKQTALAGNMTLSAVSRAVCMVFNKNIWTQYGDPDVNLYSLVENHAWTVDRYLEIASSVSADLNGDGKMDVNDLYGLNMGRGFKGYIGFFLTSAGVRFTKEIDGVQTFTLISDEIGINLMTKLVDAMEQVGYYYNEDTSVDSFAPSDFFKNGHALFTQGVPHDIYKLRDMN